MLFDHTKIERSLERAQKQFSDEERFLYRWAEEQIKDRLKDIKRTFENTLIISDFPINLETAQNNTPQTPHDCIISLFNLHRINDPETYLSAIKQSLKPDGFFIGLFFGGETLKELNQSLISAETSLSGGSHQRTLPNMTKQQAGSLMQSAGFNLPVIDSEFVHIGYQKLETLYQDLRAMGETSSLSNRSNITPPKALFSKTKDFYKEHFFEDKKFTATFEIIFCTGWSPDESQQKPLRPGSGKTSLKDVL